METKEVVLEEVHHEQVEERISGRGEITFLNLFNRLTLKSKESKYERHQGAREMERRLRRLNNGKSN